MGFDEWSTGKKMAVILVIILAIVAVIVAVAIYITSEVARTTENITNTITENIDNNVNDNGTTNGTTSHGNVVEVAKGDYTIKIETETGWAYYITTDGRYSQNEGSGTQTIDLGTVNTLSSITINQKGSGNTKVSILDSNGNVVAEKSNSIDYGSIYILLRIK